MRRLLRATLAAQGYSVWEASTGEEALQLAPSARPDLILMDLCMPGLDGASTTRLFENGLRHPSLSCPCGRKSRRKLPRSRREPTITSPSPSARENCWPESEPPCAGRGRTESGAVFTADELTVDLAQRLVRINPNGCSDADRIRPAARADPERRQGADTPSTGSRGVGRDVLRGQSPPGAGKHQQSPPQAGIGPRAPAVHPDRAGRRLSHGDWSKSTRRGLNSKLKAAGLLTKGDILADHGWRSGLDL